MTQPPYPSGPPQQGGPGPTGQRQTAGDGAWPGRDAYPAARPGFPPPPPQGPPPGGGTGGPGDPNGGQRPPRLPGGVIALIALAVVVVLGVVGFITFDSLTRDKPETSAAPSSSSQPAQSRASGEGTPSATASESDGDRPDDVEAFDSASGNIHCEIGTDYARCLIDQVASSFQAPEAPENCSAPNYGRVAVATPSKVGYECSEVSMPTGGDKLAYGKSIKKSGMKCTSTKSGMECSATSGGKGFKIARAGITWSK